MVPNIVTDIWILVLPIPGIWTLQVRDDWRLVCPSLFSFLACKHAPEPSLSSPRLTYPFPQRSCCFCRAVRRESNSQRAARHHGSHNATHLAASRARMLSDLSVLTLHPLRDRVANCLLTWFPNETFKRTLVLRGTTFSWQRVVECAVVVAAFIPFRHPSNAIHRIDFNAPPAQNSPTSSCRVDWHGSAGAGRTSLHQNQQFSVSNALSDMDAFHKKEYGEDDSGTMSRSQVALEDGLFYEQSNRDWYRGWLVVLFHAGKWKKLQENLCHAVSACGTVTCLVSTP